MYRLFVQLSLYGCSGGSGGTLGGTFRVDARCRVKTDSIETLHIWCHIIITSDDERPTSQVFAEEPGLMVLLPGRQYGTSATGGVADYAGRCIIIAPDYEGYGITKDRPHPYLCERIAAQQVVTFSTGLAKQPPG